MVDCPNLVKADKCRIGGFAEVDPNFTCNGCDWPKQWEASGRCEHLTGKVKFTEIPRGNLKKLEEPLYPKSAPGECKKTGRSVDLIYCRDTCTDRD